eukprot:1138557-Pelagomonas_calceolata.AAC.2
MPITVQRSGKGSQNEYLQAELCTLALMQQHLHNANAERPHLCALPVTFFALVTSHWFFMHLKQAQHRLVCG